MTSRSLLPPAFLLPAWSHRQLILLGFKLSQCRNANPFSSQQATRESQRIPADDSDSRQIYAVYNGQNGRKIAQTYASRRQNRFEKGNEEIRRRILAEKTTPVRIRRTSGRNHGSEIVQEDELIANYIKNQAKKSLDKKDNVSPTRSTPLNANDLRMYTDLKEGEGEEDASRRIEDAKLPAPAENDLFQSPAPALYPPSRKLHVSEHSDVVADSQEVRTDNSGNHITNQDTVTEGADRAGIGSESIPETSGAADSRKNRKTAPKERSLGVSQKSLLEELFPEQVAKTKPILGPTQKQSQHKEPRELPLPAVDDLQDDSILKAPRILARNVITKSDQPSKPVPTLLVLENALPNLVEADFRRVSPKGKHIEDWRTTFDPSAIIPARTDTTGECTGKYYLVFSNLAHAKAWRSRVELLHKITKMHAANSIVAPLIPRKGFTTQGEDIGETLREYSIFSIGVEPLIKLHSDPQADPTLQNEVKMILARLKPSDGLFQSGRSVLLWIDGWTVGTDQVIKKMLIIDGRARNMPWGDSGYQNILEEYHNQIPMVREKDQDPTSNAGRGPKRWLITLRDEAEARRFVRAWHMRPFPAWLKYKKDDHDEPWPLIRTELIW